MGNPLLQSGRMFFCNLVLANTDNKEVLMKWGEGVLFLSYIWEMSFVFIVVLTSISPETINRYYLTKVRIWATRYKKSLDSLINEEETISHMEEFQMNHVDTLPWRRGHKDPLLRCGAKYGDLLPKSRYIIGVWGATLQWKSLTNRTRWSKVNSSSS